MSPAREAQRPRFSRTLRVRNENQIGVLAAVLTVIARHGGNVGDIRTVHTGRTSVVRDIDLVVDDLTELAAILTEFQAMPETTVLEVRDEVLSAHVGGKIRVVSRFPIETIADLGRVYTPGVGEVCQRIFEDPELANHYTIIPNTVAIVSDGSAVLGLGNLGPRASMPVLEGKAALLSYLVGVNAVPIALRSQEPDDVVQAVSLIAGSFGLVQLEDIASPRCFEIEPRAQAAVDIPVFHDDQHGTAAVVLAALINACSIVGTGSARLKIGQIGLGAAGLAIAKAVMRYTDRPVLGADKDESAVERLVAAGGVASSVDEVCRACDVVIATTGQPGLISPDMVREGQIIFALSNPRPEIDAGEALIAGARLAEGGAAINNLLCYPGACRGLLDAGAKTARPEVFQAASEALVDVTPPGNLLPDSLNKLVHTHVARAVARTCLELGIATRDLAPDYFSEE